MVRTRADNTARKAVAAKAPRKILGASSAGSSSAAAAGLASPAGKYAGGNGYCPRPTPDWQKGMGSFLVKAPEKESDKENDEPADIEMGEASSTAQGGSSSSSSSAAAACATTPTKDSSQGSSSSPSQPSSSSSSSKTQKNGLISDSDED